MSLQLTFGGSEAVLVRNTGIANAVQGFVSDETVVSKNVTALPTTFFIQLYKYIQIPLISVVGNIVWVKVSGTWRQATPFIKVSGTWRQATPFIKVNDIWK